MKNNEFKTGNDNKIQSFAENRIDGENRGKALHQLNMTIQEIISVLQDREHKKYSAFKQQVFSEMLYDHLIKEDCVLNLSELFLSWNDITFRSPLLSDVTGSLSHALIRGFFSNGNQKEKYITPVYKDLGNILLYIDSTRAVDMIVIDKKHFLESDTNQIPVYLIDSKTSSWGVDKQLHIIKNHKYDQKLHVNDPLRMSIIPLLGKIMIGEAQKDPNLLEKMHYLSEKQGNSTITLKYYPVKLTIVTGINVNNFRSTDEIRVQKDLFYEKMDQLRNIFKHKEGLL